MPKQKNRTELLILGFLGLLTVVALVFFLRDEEPSSDPDAEPPIRTTYSANSQGVLGYYLLLERLGFSPRRLRKPSLGVHLKGTDVLLFLHQKTFDMFPRGVPLQPGEVQSLKKWVNDGGVLVCTESVLHDLHSVELSATAPSLNDSRLEGPLARDVNGIAWNAPLGLEPNKKTRRIGEFRFLLRRKPAVYIAEIRRGKGRYILLADTGFLSNDKINDADNAVLATNLMSYCRSVSRGSAVAFDEYHHGYGTHTGGWGLLLGSLWSTPPGWAVLTITAAALGYLFLKGRRFGTRRGIVSTQRRSKMEYVTSLGATYRSAKANRLVYGLLHKWFRRRIARMLHLAVNTGDERMAIHMEALGKADRDTYRRVLQTAREMTKQTKISNLQLGRQLVRLRRMEMEMHHGRTASR